MESKICAGSAGGGTIKLYENDGYIKCFDAVVLECVQKGKTFDVVVDKTAFFPEGGGQNADTGWIGDARVIDVKERAGIVYHQTDRPLETGTTVTGKIDWQRRFDYMQQHSGEHIVSGIVHRNFGYDNVGFHLGDAVVTLDFNGVLTQEDLDDVEWKANQAVFENRDIVISYPDKSALARMDYRSKIEIDGQVRIVTVDGYDVCACCAPHVTKTGEIGLIKIVGCQKYKGGVRVSIDCGFRALTDYRVKQKNVSDISVLLSSKSELTASAVEKLHQDMQDIKYKFGEVSEKLMLARLELLDKDALHVCMFEDSMDAPIMRKTVNAMTAAHAGYCGLFVGNDEAGYKFLIGCADGDAREALNCIKKYLSCRGGGSREMVQGQIMAPKNAVESAFKALYECE